MDPELRFIYTLARDLGKTVEELMYGRPMPLSHVEFIHWKSLYMIEMEEAERARQQSKLRR